MDLEDCSVSGYSSSSRSSAADVANDRIVEMELELELEAAEALANLAHLAMRDSGAPETATDWGNKGKRIVKSESPSSHSGLDLNSLDPVMLSSDPADDQAIIDQQQDQTMCNDVIIKQVKAEQDAESLKPSPTCPTPISTSMGGGRSRQNLTEAEKEERRIRRILANRESARQTIRRRQAMCEELTRKAAELARENEYLKREKELAVKDHLSLETINKHLKAQVAKGIKTEAGENPGELKLVNAAISTSQPEKFPLLLYNHHPFSPPGWPAIIHSSNIPSTGNLDSYWEQENRLNMNSMGTPLYLVPCPWFFPLHDSNGNGFHAQPSYGLKSIQDEASMHNGDGASSSSRSITHVESHHLSLPIKSRSEAFGSTEARTTNDPRGIHVGCLPDGSDLQTGPHPREAKLTHELLCSVGGAFIVKHENADFASVFPDKKQEPVNCLSKKLEDAVAATEARKRRKELTKLKNLHGHHCRMQC